MTGFEDIAPLTKVETISGKDIEFSGVTLHHVANLLNRFPELYTLFQKEKRTKLTPEKMANLIIKTAPDAVVAILAAGANNLNNKKAETAASRVSIGEQLKALITIIELSWPDGFGPFVEQLESLGRMVDGVPVEVGNKLDVAETSENSSPAPLNS